MGPRTQVILLLVEEIKWMRLVRLEEKVIRICVYGFLFSRFYIVRYFIFHISVFSRYVYRMSSSCLYRYALSTLD